MPRLSKDTLGVEPVDPSGASLGPQVTLRAGTEFTVTVPKLKRPDDAFETWWCEIRVDERLYRLPLRLLQSSRAA
jgi:hypothetical protein